MKEDKHNFIPWEDEFVRIQLKELSGEDLSEEEKQFLHKIDLIEKLFPGNMSNQVLANALQGLEMSNEELDQELNLNPIVELLAKGEKNLYQLFEETLDKGKKKISIILEDTFLDKPLYIDLFEIVEATQKVKCLSPEGFVVIWKQQDQEAKLDPEDPWEFEATTLQLLDYDYELDKQEIYLIEK